MEHTATGAEIIINGEHTEPVTKPSFKDSQQGAIGVGKDLKTIASQVNQLFNRTSVHKESNMIPTMIFPLFWYEEEQSWGPGGVIVLPPHVHPPDAKESLEVLLKEADGAVFALDTARHPDWFVDLTKDLVEAAGLIDKADKDELAKEIMSRCPLPLSFPDYIDINTIYVVSGISDDMYVTATERGKEIEDARFVDGFGKKAPEGRMTDFIMSIVRR